MQYSTFCPPASTFHPTPTTMISSAEMSPNCIQMTSLTQVTWMYWILEHIFLMEFDGQISKSILWLGSYTQCALDACICARKFCFCRDRKFSNVSRCNCPPQLRMMSSMVWFLLSCRVNDPLTTAKHASHTSHLRCTSRFKRQKIFPVFRNGVAYFVNFTNLRAPPFSTLFSR